MITSGAWDSTDSFDSRAKRPGVVTIWFVSAADPVEVLAAEPDYDRGFGRKILALYDSRLPVTPIGDFPLNRSAEVGPGEFYIGGFDGLAVVQTTIDDVSRLSQLSQSLREGIAATDVYAVASDAATGFGAFAHWRAGELKRAFAATRVRILEDEGLPAGCEGAYWAGRFKPELDDESNSPRAGVGLPFVPAQLAKAVISDWLGFNPYESAHDIPISAFAIDGRRVGANIASPHTTAGYAHSAYTSGQTAEADYDDYEDHEALPGGDVREKLQHIAEVSVRGISTASRKTAHSLSRAWSKFRKR